MIGDRFLLVKRILRKEKRILIELNSLYSNLRKENVPLVRPQIQRLKEALIKTDQIFYREIQKIHLISPLPTKNYSMPTRIERKIPVIKIEKPVKNKVSTKTKKLQRKEKKLVLPEIERTTLKRLRKKEKVTIIHGEKKPSKYFNLSNRVFFTWSRKLAKKPLFKDLERDLNKTNLQFILPSYIAIMMMNTLISFILAIFLFIFFLFFNIGATLPIVTFAEAHIAQRFLQVFWIIFIIPVGAFFVSYIYPSLERKAAENGINLEIPFATIHMAAISGSMVEPSKIFRIILSTKEYPFISKELTKLINEINIYGKDLVTALKRTAYNSPSSKLADLLNGLATTINSGGALPEFFEKRAETLLFEYRIEKEKVSKAAETFMDIYISVVIAAPMILMLLLVMMKISGLGLSLSTPMIGLVMIMGVSVLNIIFLTFLFLKNPKE